MSCTRTKIVATIGPASGNPQTVRELVGAGVDVFRLNFSHGNHAEHARYVEMIRAAARDADEPVAIMQDLQGPRIRTGRLAKGGEVELAEGAEVTLRHGDFAGDAQSVAVSYEHFAEDVKPGDTVLLADGLVELKVLSAGADGARCRVEVGGRLGENKGINLPGVALSIAAPTEKDLEDLAFGLEQGVDFVALSFVRSAQDVRRLKEELARHGEAAAGVPVIAKIEKPEAVQDLRAVLEASDGAMVARGDLGIEMATEAVPAVQKQIIRMANRLGMPVITATQMLESMICSPRPTRAEASDVANAILDGTDAVMLSGETSVGRYPVQAVRIMDRIAQHIEGIRAQEATAPELELEGAPRERALAEAACEIARSLGAAGVVAFTLTGSTARYISQRRPQAPIYALTPEEATYRRLALVWGVRAVRVDVFQSTDQMIEQAQERLLDLGLVSRGETVVTVAGDSPKTPGGTDMLKIQTL